MSMMTPEQWLQQQGQWSGYAQYPMNRGPSGDNAWLSGGMNDQGQAAYEEYKRQAMAQQPVQQPGMPQPPGNPYTVNIGASLPSAANFKDMGAAGLYGANLAGGLMSDPNYPVRWDSDVTLDAQNQIQNIASSPNPYLDQGLGTLTGQTTGYSPYNAANNPFLAGLQGFNDQQNTALNDAINAAQEDVYEDVDSRFGLGGRTGSGHHATILAREGGRLGAQMRSDNFNNNMNRGLTALNYGANAWQNNQQFNQDVYQGDINNQYRAASELPGMAQQRYYDPQMLQNLGNTIDDKNYNLAMTPYDALGNYGNILSSLQGTQAYNRDKVSTSDKLIGLLGAASGFGGLFGG